MRPTRAFHAAWRAFNADHAGLREIQVAITASFSIESLLPFLGCFLAERGLFARFSIAPYNQIHQTLLDPRSAVRQGQDVVVVLPRLEDMSAAPLGRVRALESPIEPIREACLAEVDRLWSAVRELEAATHAQILVGNFPPPASTALGPFDASHPASERQIFRDANTSLWHRLDGDTRVRVFDLAGVVESVGTDASYDPRMQLVARCPFSSALLRRMGHDLARAIAPLFIAPAKVVVLDLDNTLWGGVIGEEGVAGIALGDHDVGAAFVAFQEALLALRSQGVLLAVASKNNEADAFEVFDKHPAMRITRKDLSAHRINWNDKAASLREIAEELSLGLDSFVFVDDNPVECEAIRRLLPAVRVLQLPEDPAQYVAALRGVQALDRMTITAEDRARPERQRMQQLRKIALATSDRIVLADHLRSLELKVDVRRMLKSDVARVAQLTQKTNQFNLTTIRRSEAEIAALAADPSVDIFVAEIADRFGEYGLTAVMIVRAFEPTACEIDTLLLSCRVLGRKVETGFLAAIAAELVKKRGATRLVGKFVPTAKNDPARGYLEAHGFQPQRDVFVLDLETARFDAGDHLFVSFSP